MSSEILDEHEAVEVPTYSNLLNWWTAKWFLYNVIVGAVGLISMGIVFFYLKTYMPSNILRWSNITWILMVVAFYAAACNCCYFLGWLADIIFLWLFEKTISTSIKNILYLLGLLFSIFPPLAVMFLTLTVLP